MANIEHRGANSWRIGVQLPVSQGRKWVRRSFTYPPSMTEDEQQRAIEIELARLVVDVADGKAKPETPMTVRQLYDIWMRDHVTPDCKRTTASTYKNLMEGRILPLIGDRPVSRLTPLELTRMMNAIKVSEKKSTAIPAAERKRKRDRERVEKPPVKLSSKTTRHYYDVLNYMFNKGVQWQLIYANPLAAVDRPKHRRKKKHFLDDDQAVILLRKLALEESLPFRCAVLLALVCGLRLGEVSGLYLDDVDWKMCTINIERALSYTGADGNYLDTPKSEQGERVIALPAGMMALLDETRKYHEDVRRSIGDRWRGDGRIVSNWDGSPMHHDTPSKQFRRFADKNGFEGITFHMLRGSHASILLANNMDAVTVAQRMGHASAETTLRYYASAVKRRDLESARHMQNLLDRAAEPPQQVGTPTQHADD